MSTCCAFVRFKFYFISAFDFDLIQIEYYVNIIFLMWKSKTYPEQHYYSVHNKIEDNFIVYSYVLQVQFLFKCLME